MNETTPARAVREVLAGVAAPHGAMALARHAPRTGARVLVLDCGSGDACLDLGRLVGPKGNVIGIDQDEELLTVGVEQARSLCAANVSFVRADAAAHLFDATWDVVFARFAPTLFEAPRAALAMLRNALTENGRLLLVTWGALAENPWFDAPSLHVRTPLAPSGHPSPGDSACGPFSLSEPECVRSMLEDAGYREFAFERVHASVVVGGSRMHSCSLCITAARAS